MPLIIHNWASDPKILTNFLVKVDNGTMWFGIGPQIIMFVSFCIRLAFTFLSILTFTHFFMLFLFFIKNHHVCLSEYPSLFAESLVLVFPFFSFFLLFSVNQGSDSSFTMEIPSPACKEKRNTMSSEMLCCWRKTCKRKSSIVQILCGITNLKHIWIECKRWNLKRFERSSTKGKVWTT